MQRWVVRAFLPALAALAVGAIGRSASGFAWPGESTQVDRALTSGDVVRRRDAVDRLVEMGVPLAIPLLLRALGDPDLEVRLRAARAATRLRSTIAADRVIPWLTEPEPELRIAACRLVERAPTRRAVAALGRVLSDADAGVRAAAAAAMGASGYAEATGPLLGHLDDSSATVRAEVAEALARVGDASAVIPLVGKVSDGAVEVRQAVVRALGSLGDARATGALVLALRDGVESVKIEALAALGKVGGEQAAPAIAPLLEGRLRPEVRRAALRALGAIASDTAARILIQALSGDDPAVPESELRDAIVATGRRSIEPLRAALRAPSSEMVASGAALALGALGAREARRDLIGAMQRKTISSGVALRALSALGDPESVSAVLPLIRDRDALVRDQALEAVALLLDPTLHDGLAVDPLAADLSSSQSSPAEKEKIARALGRTGSPRALAGLVPLLATQRLGLKLAAIDALGTLGPVGQDAVLMAALDDDRGSVRMHAALALARSAGASAVAPLLSRLGDAAEQDRGAVGLAVSGALSRATKPDVARAALSMLARVGPRARDVIIEGLGRMPDAAAGKALVDHLEGRPDTGDRRKIAEALAGHADRVAALLAMTDDADAATRAHAAWSLGRASAASGVRDTLERLALRDPSPDVAANAVAALALLAAQANDAAARDRARLWLCDRLSDARAYVRANALSGLVLLRGRCDAKGEAVEAPELATLAHDPVELVRWAAARLLASVSAEGTGRDAGRGERRDRDDARALARCAADDRSGRVAAACAKRGPQQPTATASPSGAAPGVPFTVFVVPDGRESPVPLAPYSLLRADGLIRSGSADRNGAAFELAAPLGDVSLVVPAPLAF